MTPVFFSRRAKQDMLMIGRYIAQDNPAAAENLLRHFYERAHQLMDSPYLGPKKEELGKGCRYLVIKNYLIIYRVTGSGVNILRIVHGARYLPGLI